MGWLFKDEKEDDRPQLVSKQGTKVTTKQKHGRGKGKTTTTHDSASGVTKSETRYGLRDFLGW